MEKVNAKFKAGGEYNDGILKCTLQIYFRPYDCTEWKDEYAEYKEGSGEEELQWLQSTLYNYIPFAIIRNKREGIYNDIYTGEWEELQETLFWDNTKININADWSLGDYGKDETNLFTRDLKSLAIQNITKDEKWYETPIGRVFAFSNALNGNFAFSANTEKIGFSQLLKSVIEGGKDSDVYKKNEVWKQETEFENRASVILTTTIPVPNDHKNHTYAIVAANPFDRAVFTEYIYIENEPILFDKTKFEYIDGSLQTNGCGNKIQVSAEQSTDKSVSLKLKMGNMQWTKLHPQIKFRVKLKRLLS